MGETLCLTGDLRPFLEGQIAEDLVGEYFSPNDNEVSGWTFSGGAFEIFDGGGDTESVRDEITTADLVAVTFLGVEVPAHAALALTDPMAAEITALLSQVPTNIELYSPEARDRIRHGGPADRLWTAIYGLDGMGEVTTGKLLARKRPRLLPVFDSVVQAALQPDGADFWIRLQNELQDPAVVERLNEIHKACGLDHRISLIRVLDAAVWMRNRRASDRKIAFSGCPNSQV